MGMGARYILALHSIQRTLATQNNKAHRNRYKHGRRTLGIGQGMGQLYWSMLHKITKSMLLNTNQLLTNRATNEKIAKKNKFDFF